MFFCAQIFGGLNEPEIISCQWGIMESDIGDLWSVMSCNQLGLSKKIENGIRQFYLYSPILMAMSWNKADKLLSNIILERNIF